jgi:hypothetical protein
MAQVIKIEGMDKVIANLKGVKSRIAPGVNLGLKRAGSLLLRESQKIVPVQTGNLKASGFMRAFPLGIFTDVVVGYTAFYAAYVHENPDAVHGKEFNIKHADKIAALRGKKGGTAAGGFFRRGENQQYKFLETPARVNRTKMLRMIRDSVF